MYGQPCDLTALASFCSKRELLLVEDCAQGLGAEHAGRPVGGTGAAACYSFYANKVLTTGEGGMVTTDDADLARRLRSLRSNALAATADRPYLHTEVGFNYRMSSFAAAVGTAQLGRLDDFLAHKQAIAEVYQRRLGHLAGLALWHEPDPPDRHAHWANVIVVDSGHEAGDVRRLAAALTHGEVETRGLYHPLHLHPTAAQRQSLPVSEALAPRGLVLPSGNALPLDDAERVCDLVEAWAVGVRQ
jgi:perosamine synthetase